MRETHRSLAGGLAALLGLAGPACGDGRPPEVPLEDVPAELARASCEAARECIAGLLSVLGLDEGCEAEYEARLEDGSLPLWQDAIDEGALAYDPALVDDCRAAISRAGCDYFANPDLPPCREVLLGERAEGDACRTGVECEPGLACDLSGGCPGVCRARGGAGSTCLDDQGCDYGLTCQGGACAEPAADGEACGGSVGVDCRPGLLCLGEDRDEPGTCLELGSVMTEAEGAPCDPLAGTLCREGLSCVLQSIVPFAFECVATSAPGGPCGYGTPDPCPRGEACDVDTTTGDLEGTCRPLPGPGEPCLTASLVSPCAEGLECLSGICAALQRNGAPCTRPDQCYSATCQDGRCAPPPCAG